jgi:hypothetical protein
MFSGKGRALLGIAPEANRSVAVLHGYRTARVTVCGADA